MVAGVSRTGAGPRLSGEHANIRLVLAQGEAGAAIVEFARHNASDLIALAWRGSLEPERAQTMRRVIREASCPVIVFRVQAMMTLADHISLREFEAFLFDLDGVVTRTASVHATAWKQLFDDYLERRARAEGSPSSRSTRSSTTRTTSTADPGRQVSKPSWRLGASRCPLAVPMTGRRSRL